MRKLILGICVLFGVPAISQAGPITVGDFTGVFVGYFSPVTTGESRAQLGSSLMGNGSDISPAIDGLTFEAYCVDVLGPIFDPGTPQPPATFDATAGSMQGWNRYSGAQANAGGYAAWLYTEYAAANAAIDVDTHIGQVSRTALQMAIWNVLYDIDFTVNAGAFMVSDVSADDLEVRLVANGYLTNLSANLTAAVLSDATWLQLRECAAATCADVQDFIGPGLSEPAPVPEPATMSLFAVGLGAIGFRRLRLRRSTIRRR